MAVVLALLGPAIQVVKLFTKPIVRQFNYLCCFTSNINSLNDEAKNLDDALSGLEEEIERARDNVQEPSAEVNTWLTKSQKIRDEIDQIVSEATTVESGYLKHLGARFSLSKKAKKMTDRIKEIQGKKKFEVKFQQAPPVSRQAIQFGKTFECKSRNKIEEEIMTTLRGGEVNMIGICGMGGLGKTTMAQKIRNRVLNENVFQEVAMVVVRQPVYKSKIQVEIGGSLGLYLEDKTSETRVQKLHARLSSTKTSTLLILDDVWEKLVLEDFGIPRDSKGCTILLTSRDSGVLRDMDVQIFGMKVLSEEEAWLFFRERVGTCVDDTKLNPIAQKVAKECKGLPIALTSVSAVLKDEDDVSIWEDARRQLRHSDPDIPTIITEVYNPLKLSYDWLRSEQAKSMFLLFCLFREDVDIPLEYLTYFCVGLGIYKGIRNLREARNKTRALTKMLKSRSLLFDSDYEDCVRMHDVVRDVSTFIAKEEGYIGKDGCTWISSSHLVTEGNVFLSGSTCPNLRLLFLDSRCGGSLGFNFDDAFFEGMREIKVLCIQKILGRLPHPMQSFGKLKTLILESSKGMKTISFVGELINLEILIFRRCDSIEELPSKMKGLNRLKVLELTRCWKLNSIGRGIIASLVRLEELKMLDSFNGWEAEEREERQNASIKELEALTNLACLEIDIEDPSLVTENMPRFSKKIVRFIIRTDKGSYFPSEFGQAMRLYLERESILGDWIEMQLLRDTQRLYLIGNGANNVELAKIQNIRWLKLAECESMKNVDATVLPSIEHLELESLPELQEICDGPISSTSFHNLRELELENLTALRQIWKSSSLCQKNNVPHFNNLSFIDIRNCHSLRNLGQLSMAGMDCLPQLEQLIIRNCLMMEQVFLWNEDEEAGENKTGIESQQKRHVIFPKLKEVELVCLQNLTTFYQGIQGIEFPLLREMKIKECPNWKNIIIGSSGAGIDDDDLLLVLNKKASFSSLEVLMIDHVGSMSIFTLSVTANLRELSIRNCDEMIAVIEDEQQQQRILLFPKLEELYLDGLPKLVSFCNWKCEVELPSLRKVEIERCPNMKNFNMGLVATPNLEAFETDLTTYVGVGGNNGFSRLKQLKISRSENPLYDDKISPSIFNGLEKLTFILYKGSKSLLTSSAVGNLVNLKELCIGSCDEIVKVIEDGEEEDDEKVVVNGGAIRTVVFPKLEELYLRELPKLQRFCEWKCDVELPSLRRVAIMECPNMESISIGFVAAPDLKIVNINDLRDIGATQDLNGLLLVNSYFARQKGVSFDRSLRVLEINCSPVYDHKIPLSMCNGLEELTINECVGSMSIFTLSVAANLVNLRKLCIKNCDEMMKVIEDEQQQQRIPVFPKLEKQQQRIILFPKLGILQLEYLPILVRFCDWKCEVELPSLRKVQIERCPNMESFSMGVVATPNLEAFTTDLYTYVGVGVDVAFNRLKKLNITLNQNPFDHHKISVSLFNGLEELELDYWFTSRMSLFQSSAVGNLASLRVLKIVSCHGTLVNVIEEDGKVVSGGVLFPKLEELYLWSLTKLVRFCEWKCDVQLPSLTTVEITDCPYMENFSMGLVATPNLKFVKIDHQEIDATKDLNDLLLQHYVARQEKEEKEKEEEEEEESSQENDEIERPLLKG